MYGERIRRLRKENNMTLRELADELGISFTALGNYEREDREPSFQFFLDLANYFGVSMDYFSGRDNVISTDEYLLASYTEDLIELFSKADPEIRKLILDIHDQLFLITCEHAIGKPNIKELELLQQIVNSISKMKNGFGIGLSKGGFPPSTKFELAKLYLKEKQKIDSCFNELFGIYVERKVTNTIKQDIENKE